MKKESPWMFGLAYGNGFEYELICIEYYFEWFNLNIESYIEWLELYMACPFEWCWFVCTWKRLELRNIGINGDGFVWLL